MVRNWSSLLHFRRQVIIEGRVTNISGNQNVQTRNVNQASPHALGYGGNGNLANRANTRGAGVYIWNALNQLVSARLGSTTVLQNWCDAYGRRIAKQEGAAKRYYGGRGRALN